jgi:hypothetical protein
MESEYIRSINLHQILLRKKDFLRLIEILMESPNGESPSLELTISNKDVDITITSFDELKEYQQDEDYKKIRIKVSLYSTGDRSLSYYIAMDLYKTSASYYINSNDQIWFYGKITQINDYLRKYKPWYSILRKICSPFLIALFGFVLGSFDKIFKNINIYLLLSLSALLIILFALMFISYHVLPYTKIHLKDKAKEITPENITIFITIMSFFVALIGLIVSIIK